MLRAIFVSALLAGLMAGVTASALQHFTTTPLILAAEVFEQSSAHDHGTAEAWAPADGLERTAFTALATTLAGIGFALILTALMALSGRSVDARSGLLWGLAAFAAVTLAPSAGLAPELPGSVAAGLEARQLWWIATVVATGGGLWLLAFRQGWALRVLALALMVAPHAIGAPHVEGGAGAVPPELAARFAATSIAVAGVYWVLLGLLAGHFLGRAKRVP
jgi:cobalt transporter subunit CbtA